MKQAVYTGWVRKVRLRQRFAHAPVLTCVVLSVVHTAPTVHAQSEPEVAGEEQAANLFEAAESAFANKDYERAARLFERANNKAPHASVTFNAAVSWDYAGKRAQAADAYQLALSRGGLETGQTTQAEQRLAELRNLLGYVNIAKPVGGLASVDHIVRQQIPFRFYEEPGTYRIELETAAGERTTTEITVVAGETLRVELNPVERQPAPPQPEVAAPPPPVVLPDDNTNTASSTQEVLGWVGIGMGVLAAGAATYWGVQVWQNRDAYLAGGRRDAALYNETNALVDRTNLGWLASGVTGALGVTLVLTSPTFKF